MKKNKNVCFLKLKTMGYLLPSPHWDNPIEALQEFVGREALRETVRYFMLQYILYVLE